MTSESQARGVCRGLPDEETDGEQAGRLLAPPHVAKSQEPDEALGENAAIVRALLSTLPDMVFRIDGAGTYLGFIPSSGLEPLVPPSKFLGRKIDNVLPAELAEQSMSTIKRALQTGEQQSFEYQLVVGGEVHDQEARIVASGKSEVLVIVRDITGRRRAEARAELERQRLETLIDVSPVGVFVADSAGQIILINREAQRVLGFSHQPEYQLRRYEEAAVYRRPDGSPYEREDLPLQRALHQGETVRAEEILYDFPDGHAVPTLIDATPLYSTDGQIDGAIAIIQDIRPLEEVEKLRNGFLELVSHELRTPITAIKGAAAIVLGSPGAFDASETRDLFQIVDEQAERLRALIDNLLDMSHIEAGMFSVSLEPTDLGALLNEALKNFVASGGSQEVRVEVPDGLPAVSADGPKIVQVLTNLLSNAAKFSPEVAVVTVAVARDCDHVTVRVQDQGRGIAKEKLSHLFKKFSQVHGDGGRTFSGSGLGLAICKGIVEAHGGRIWAESAGAGQGSTFTFTLSICNEAGSESALNAARAASGSATMLRASGRMRVLVVDDDRQVLRHLRRLLCGLGYQVVVTSDPSQVAERVEMEQPDLILLDLILPKAEGFDVLQRIRQFSDVPVIFLTASEQSDHAVRALRLGADDYITKPFSPTELLARMDAVLRRRARTESVKVRAPFVLGDLTVDFAERRVTVRDRTVALTATEYKLLVELATHAGQVLTHDQILQRAWGPEYSGETDLLRSFIRSLRKKLGDDARHPSYVFTETRVGYRMAKPG